MSIVRQEVAQQLSTKLKLEEVSVQTMNGVAKQVMGAVHLQISPGSENWFDTMGAFTTKTFAFGSTRLPWADYMSYSAVFKGLQAENYDEIDLLVGNYLEELFWPVEAKENRLVDQKGV